MAKKSDHVGVFEVTTTQGETWRGPASNTDGAAQCAADVFLAPKFAIVSSMETAAVSEPHGNGIATTCERCGEHSLTMVRASRANPYAPTLYACDNCNYRFTVGDKTMWLDSQPPMIDSLDSNDGEDE